MATGFDTVLGSAHSSSAVRSASTSTKASILAGTAVNFKQRDSLVLDFRTSKTEGQSNFVNPGVFIVGYGLDADVTPKLKGFVNANYIWTIDTDTTEQVLFTNRASNDFGLDCSVGFQWRPLLTDNVIVTRGSWVLGPSMGLQGYLSGKHRAGLWVSRASAGQVDDFLYSGIVTVTLTY